MKFYQIMRIHRKYLPPVIVFQNKALPSHFDNKGYVYIEIHKGMYSLKEAAILAYEQLCAHLQPFGYAPVCSIPGLWRHIS